jgi:ketosteroid isomerase-like protein
MPEGTEIPATGKTVGMHGVSVITVRDGKFAIQHHYFDTAAMASQLGLMPGT